MSDRSGEERERKQPRSLASSTLDFAPLNSVPADHAVLGVGQSMPMSKADSSVRMETLIDSAEASYVRTGSTPSQVDGRSDVPRAREGRVEGSACR